MAWRRALVGVNGSPASREALAQAGRLLAADGELRLVAAVDGWNPIGGAAGSDHEQRVAAAELLRALESELAPAEPGVLGAARGVGAAGAGGRGCGVARRPGGRRHA
jgi:hypothetical protein